MDPVTIAGLALTVTTVLSLIGLHASRVRVNRAGRWTNPPEVYVYRHAAVNIDQVRAACDAITAKTGLQFGGVRSIDEASIIPGAIVVGPPSAEAAQRNALAAASWLPAFPGEDEVRDKPSTASSRAQDIIGPIDDGCIRWAYVHVDDLGVKDRDAVRILAHELLHAMGYLHCETALLGRWKKDGKRRDAGEARLGLVGRKSGHLMHPVYDDGGWDVSGIA